MRDGYRRGSGRGWAAATRLPRVLSLDDLKRLLLALIADDERHGYELIRLIKARSRGAYAPSPGMVYPALADMAEAGLIEQCGEDAGRKSYRIAAAGRAEREAQAEAVAKIEQRLAELGQSAPQRSASIERALRNLEMAVEHAVGSANAARIEAIVDQIDATARTIERLPGSPDQED